MDKFEVFDFDPTAFMSGQMFSKLWLCEALYGTLIAHGMNPRIGGFRIHILAGWYCLTNVLLHSHGRIPIDYVASFDSDPKATHGAMVLNEAFHHNGTFEALTEDINTYVPYAYGGGDYPDIVINTAVEHIDGLAWFDNIHQGTLVVLQSNDMEHLDEHTNTVKSLEEFIAKYPMSKILYSGQKHFDYDSWNFNRFMTIGLK